ncbi:hypothetical protein NPIL_425511 [Nephila pilipes]|uniref:Uncharacterized protein n=1 Tax=Nephila pilipes TaxID=299642 RepID=A0A8X6U8S0_NEPPI|nr:hypothetical protein NPIL_425511 [Nephila pilipes]
MLNSPTLFVGNNRELSSASLLPPSTRAKIEARRKKRKKISPSHREWEGFDFLPMRGAAGHACSDFKVISMTTSVLTLFEDRPVPLLGTFLGSPSKGEPVPQAPSRDGIRRQSSPWNSSGVS